MPDQSTIEQPKRHRCRHIFVDGRRCASASLRHEEFCYYHHTTRRPASSPRARKARRSTVQLPLPEDRASIQLSIGLILDRLATNDLDPRRAGLLLYGLQIASANLPPHKNLPSHAHPLPEQPLEEVVAHPELGLLAPPADALKTREELWQDIRRAQDGLFQRDRELREREDKLREEELRLSRIQTPAAPGSPLDPDPQPPARPASQTTVLPALQASSGPQASTALQANPRRTFYVPPFWVDNPAMPRQNPTIPFSPYRHP